MNMISIKNAQNLTGVTISGDYKELCSQVEALHGITINEYLKNTINMLISLPMSLGHATISGIPLVL